MSNKKLIMLGGYFLEGNYLSLLDVESTMYKYYPQAKMAIILDGA